MQVILLDDVVGVGDIGDNVKVRPGYARNYLIPRGLAVECQTKNARMIAHRMKQVEAKKRRLMGGAKELADKLRNEKITLNLRVGSTGKVFGSLGTRDVAAGLQALGYEVDRRRIMLNDPLKKAGTHFVTVKLHPEVQVSLKVDVVEIAASKEEEEKLVESAREALETNAAETQEKTVEEN